MTGEELHRLEERLGHRFREPTGIERALTHRSVRGPAAAADSAQPDNERLEFLGDRVLGLVVSEHLCETFPQWDVGRLSRGISRLASGASLQAAATALGLGQYLRLGRGEEMTGGREKGNLLADAYEAIIAAIYLDAGLDPAAAFIRRTLLESEAGGARADWSESDDKSALQEWLQSRGLGAPQYRVARTEGPDHCKTFGVELWLGGVAVAASEGRSKKEAEQEAARLGLARLRSEEESRIASAPGNNDDV
jgi:ribonuclease-3